MEDKLICKTYNVFLTTMCTLRCKNCGSCTRLYQPPFVADPKKTMAALDKVFEIYDHVRELRFGGGEVFLYPHIEEFIRYADKYKDKFDYAIIVTNGTYLPKTSILETIKEQSYPFVVRVDRYEASTKVDEVLELIREYGLDGDERIYCGEDSFSGGWIYYGECVDRNYSDKELKRVFYNCRLPDDGIIMYEDKLTNCPYATAVYGLGKVTMPEREVVDLSVKQNIDEMRAKVRAWRDAPFEMCKYCNGFDPINGIRVPAGEQSME